MPTSASLPRRPSTLARISRTIEVPPPKPARGFFLAARNDQVKVISDASFTIRWKIGNETYQGFGTRNGDALAATYEINGKPGLVIYRVDDEGTLRGLWAVRGSDDGGTERLTPSD